MGSVVVLLCAGTGTSTPRKRSISTHEISRIVGSVGLTEQGDEAIAVFDIKYDTTPSNKFTRPRGPKISDMRTALSTFSATSYTADRLNGMSENDMVSACTIHNLTVGGL